METREMNEVVEAGRMSRLKSNVKSRAMSMKSSVSREMRGNAGKWTGIAAGAGLTLGLLARMLRSRRRITPDIIVIEAC